jgi:hypothetical protein
MPENALWTKPVAEIWVKIKEAGLELTYFDYFDLRPRTSHLFSQRSWPKGQR